MPKKLHPPAEPPFPTIEHHSAWTIRTDARLRAVYDTAPHHCAVPDCPGDLNRRRLEAFDQMRKVLRFLSANPAEMLSERLAIEKIRAALALADAITEGRGP